MRGCGKWVDAVHPFLDGSKLIVGYAIEPQPCHRVSCDAVRDSAAEVVDGHARRIDAFNFDQQIFEDPISREHVFGAVGYLLSLRGGGHFPRGAVG